MYNVYVYKLFIILIYAFKSGDKLFHISDSLASNSSKNTSENILPRDSLKLIN